MDPHGAFDGFDFQARTRIVQGVGQSARVGELASKVGRRGELEGARCLVVTDPGVRAAGHPDRIAASLRDAGFEVAIFDHIEQNPTTVDVERCLAVARELDPGLFVGIGGGSAIDTARGANMLLTNGGAMVDYRGYGKVARPMKPLVALPTTAGTGTECQSFALIADPETHQKMACGDPKASARLAILDPELTRTQPRQVTANTALDAIVHAVETAVTTLRHPLSLLYSHEAFRLLSENLASALERPDDLEARGKMQVGAAFAGIAIENSMLGAAHSTANPLTARFNIVHGQAVAVMLPQIIAFNAVDDAAREAYRVLALKAGLLDRKDSAEAATELLIERVRSLLALAGVPQSLREHGVTAEAIPELAQLASAQWTAQFNPRAIGEAEFAEVYRRSLDPQGA